MGYLKLNKDNKGDLRPKFRNNGIRGVASLCIPIALTFGNTAKAADTKAKLPEIKDDGDNKDDEKKSMEEKQRDAMIDWINKKLKNNDEKIEAFETFCKDLLDKYPDYLPLLNLKLDIYKDNENIKLVIDIADEILSKINTNELAAFFGKKVNDKNDKEYKKQLKKYKEQKSSVIDALKAKLNAIKRQLSVVKKEDDDEKGGDNKAKADPITDFVRIPKDDLKEFEDIYKQLSEWIDIEKNKKDLFDVNLFYNLQKGLISKVLTMINDKISSNNKDDKAINKDQIEMKIKLYKKYLPIKEFSFLIEQYELDLYKQFPNQYRLF